MGDLYFLGAPIPYTGEPIAAGPSRRSFTPNEDDMRQSIRLALSLRGDSSGGASGVALASRVRVFDSLPPKACSKAYFLPLTDRSEDEGGSSLFLQSFLPSTQRPELHNTKIVRSSYRAANVRCGGAV